MIRKPCGNCPWLRASPPAYWDPQHFLDIWMSCQDDGMNVMLCHKSELPETQMVCQGWVRVMGFNAIGVRIAAMQGAITLEEVGDAMEGELYFDFEEMMRANGIDPDGLRRNRFLR